MQTAPRGGAERAARPDSFLWGAGHGGAVRPQAERGSPGDGDNGFHLKGRPEPQQRTAGGPAPGQFGALLLRCWNAIGGNILSVVLYPFWGAVTNIELWLL